MSREEFEAALAALAESLEKAVPHSRTREESVRVSAHAREARRLVTAFTAARPSSAA